METSSAYPSISNACDPGGYSTRCFHTTPLQNSQRIHARYPHAVSRTSATQIGCYGYSSMANLNQCKFTHYVRSYLIAAPLESSSASRRGCTNSQHCCMRPPQRPPCTGFGLSPLRKLIACSMTTYGVSKPFSLSFSFASLLPPASLWSFADCMGARKAEYEEGIEMPSSVD